MSQALPSTSYYPSLHTNAWRTERPHTGTRGAAFALVDADTGAPVPCPVDVDYAGELVPVVHVWAHHIVVRTRAAGDVWLNPARYGWRIIVVSI